MTDSLFVSQTKLNVLLEQVCSPITYLATPINSATPLWDGPIKMCQQIEADPFAVDSIVLEARKSNRAFSDINSPRLYHAILCRVYILLYYRHQDNSLYTEIVYPRLLENMGVYNSQFLNNINERIDKILAHEKLLEKVLSGEKKKVKPVFAYVAHSRNELDHLYIEYGEELLFRNMKDIIKALAHEYGTNQDEAEVWYNAKQVVHVLRDVNRPELLIERAATALVQGQIFNEYEGSQIILICAYVMIRSAKDNAHFARFIKEMERLPYEDTDMHVIKHYIEKVKNWVEEDPSPFDDYDYIGEQTPKADTFTSADIERIRKQIVEQEKAEKDKLAKRVEELKSNEIVLKQQVSSLEKKLKSEQSRIKPEPTEEEQEVEMLNELESTPVLKLLWYLMQLDGGNVRGHGKKKPAQNIMSTISKIPFDTTKKFWAKEDDSILRQEELLMKMNHWLEAIGMKFRF